MKKNNRRGEISFLGSLFLGFRSIKEKIKEAFPCKTKKYPRWVQSEEWQISEGGKPMRFIEEKRKKGKEYKNMLYKEYYFEDVDTGEIRIVEQFT